MERVNRLSTAARRPEKAFVSSCLIADFFQLFQPLVETSSLSEATSVQTRLGTVAEPFRKVKDSGSGARLIDRETGRGGEISDNEAPKKYDGQTQSPPTMSVNSGTYRYFWDIGATAGAEFGATPYLALFPAADNAAVPQLSLVIEDAYCKHVSAGWNKAWHTTFENVP